MILKQSTIYNRQFPMVLASDHVTGYTGLASTVTVQLGKNGAAGVAATGVITRVDSVNLPGIYNIAFSTTDTNTVGANGIADLAVHATAPTCDPTDFIDQVQTTIFTDLLLDGSGRVFIASNYKQNQPALLPFTMTVGNPPVATPGLAPVGQKNFGSGFSSIVGPITDLGFGAYIASLQAADTNAPVAYYHFTSTTPNANEQDITVYFQP